MEPREWLVTLRYSGTKSFIVEAKDWEAAEDYAMEEMFEDMPGCDCDIEVTDVERV